jgi:hypothetical protein
VAAKEGAKGTQRLENPTKKKAKKEKNLMFWVVEVVVLLFLRHSPFWDTLYLFSANSTITVSSLKIHLFLPLLSSSFFRSETSLKISFRFFIFGKERRDTKIYKQNLRCFS